jgi:pimeloyl-ACP methyl ester carboxylesterase
MLKDMKTANTTTQDEQNAGSFRVLPKRPGLDGFELEFTTRGAGEPLLLVHGGLLTGWFDLLSREAALLERYRLISYHRPGYGRSSIPSAAVSLEAQSWCCLALLRHLGVEKAHVVGHSIGGCIALQLALDAPDAVRSLALLEPPVLTAVFGLVQRRPGTPGVSPAVAAGRQERCDRRIHAGSGRPRLSEVL